jgi:hypothetical protein
MGIWRAKSDQGGQRVVYMFSEYLAPDYYWRTAWLFVAEAWPGRRKTVTNRRVVWIG